MIMSEQQKQDIAAELRTLRETRLSLDLDLDGLTTREEERYGTNPYSFDTDGDGVSDSLEIGVGNNPLLDETETYQYSPPEVEADSAKSELRSIYVQRAREVLQNSTLTYEDLYQEGDNKYFFEALDLQVITSSTTQERILLLSQSPYVQFQMKENHTNLQSIFEEHVQFIEQVCDFSQKLEIEREKQSQIEIKTDNEFYLGKNF
ncbi:MAG: hypothetical protein EA365_16000 [Gloeocapsa sp. DLM2.Bin57]|nr:MAG: hypothetical protein EA365_16000 [Gloeocapsa sp. DLM2.Bin57]